MNKKLIIPVMQRLLPSVGRVGRFVRVPISKVILRTFAIVGCLLATTHGSFSQAGDGSYSTNPDLISTAQNPVCHAPCAPTNVSGAHSSTPVVALLPLSEITQPTQNLEAQAPNLQAFPVQDLGLAPREPYHPFFDIDWSVSLSATHTGGTDAGKNAVALTPQISLTHIGLREQYSFSAQASLSVNDDQLTRIDEGVLSYTSAYALDRETQFNASASLTLSQDDVNAPGVSDSIVQTPKEFVWRGQIGFARQFGQFSVDANTRLQRQYRTGTLLIGGLVQNNAELNFTRWGNTFRTSYAFTPEIALFVEGDVSHDWYDAAPIATGIKLDAIETNLTTGATINWRDVLTAELSVGYGLRRFDDTSIPDVASTIFDLNLDYAPNDALIVGAEFTTTLTPQNISAGRAASIDYNATANLSYDLAPWVGLRTSISGDWVRPLTGSNIQTTFTAGAGLDFTINKNMALNLDYLYTWAEILPVAARYQHAATIGINFSR